VVLAFGIATYLPAPRASLPQLYDATLRYSFSNAENKCRSLVKGYVDVHHVRA
jgi:hypothetical protein